MMSRRKTFPSLSSSRQMMMAWKVSGLSHRPAIMASRPASLRLAMALHARALGLLVGLLAGLFALFGGLLGLDDIHPHLAEHGENILDLLGIDLLRGHDRVDLVMGDVAPLLGGADELLDGR